MKADIKKIYIIVGHPAKKSLCSRLADEYQATALQKGYEVRRDNITDLTFDPILHEGYKQIQTLEPDLLNIQTNLKWCNELIIFYPMWWGSMPALLKGLIDRTILPGFAFHYHDNDRLWDKYLSNRTAKVFSTSGGPAIYNRFVYKNADFTIIKKAILNFVGFKNVRCKRFGGVADKSFQADEAIAYIKKHV
jgi:putative NADPH-quinone reductase